MIPFFFYFKLLYFLVNPILFERFTRFKIMFCNVNFKSAD